MKTWERRYLEYLEYTPQSAEPPRPSSGQIMHDKWAPRRELVFDLRVFGCSFKDIGEYMGITPARASSLYRDMARRRKYFADRAMQKTHSWYA